MQNHKGDNAKKQNKFGAAMKRIFVHNFGWKVLSLLCAAVIWVLAAGLA